MWSNSKGQVAHLEDNLYGLAFILPFKQTSQHNFPSGISTFFHPFMFNSIFEKTSLDGCVTVIPLLNRATRDTLNRICIRRVHE